MEITLNFTRVTHFTLTALANSEGFYMTNKNYECLLTRERLACTENKLFINKKSNNYYHISIALCTSVKRHIHQSDDSSLRRTALYYLVYENI